MIKLVIGMLTIPLALAAADPMGLPNFHQVNDRIYRGAQPTVEGFQALAQMGIKTIVDLRREDGQIREEQRTVESLGMKFLSVPMEMGAPTDQQMSRVMQELNSNAGPVFVHCHGGRDRTGTVIACYRKTHDAWDSQKALDEANLAGMRRDARMRKYVQKLATRADAGASAL
ncbi:MAG TPA: tyrosine-protein phosphatase [Bryobacteraceae bacterium]|jgi:tyrosine-protein phosphatase SIW14|nr:tyrosine-protein phosphatase [Bryobacteraceae bacterium]